MLSGLSTNGIIGPVKSRFNRHGAEIIRSDHPARVTHKLQAVAGQTAGLTQMLGADGSSYYIFDPVLVKMTLGTSGEYCYIYPSVGTTITNIEAQGYMYLKAASAFRMFIGATKYLDVGTTELAITTSAISLTNSTGGSSRNYVKLNSSDPIEVNGNSLTTPLWITGVNGFPGNTANARHALDINISLGGGGSPSSGPVTGGNAAKLNVILRAAGTGNGAADGSTGQFAVCKDTTSTQIFTVSYTGTQNVLITSTAATVVPLMIKGASSQSGAYLQIKESDDTLRTWVASVGVTNSIAGCIRNGSLNATYGWNASDWCVLTGGNGTLLYHAIAWGSTGGGFGSRLQVDGSILIIPDSSSIVASKFRGASSQSANLTEWQNSSSTTLSSVEADGLIRSRGNPLGTGKDIFNLIW